MNLNAKINSNKPDVSVIIVNYNTYDLTRNCIKSIYQNTSDVDFEVILVDNNSSDNSVERLSNEFLDLIILENNENLGFGRANNIGFDKAQGEYIFLLNSDTIIHNNSILMFLEFFRKNVELNIGVLGTILLNEDRTIGRSSSSLTSPLTIVKDTIIGLFSRIILKKRTGFVQEQIPLNLDFLKVGQVLGADMFMLKSVYEDFNGFDPDFFMYFEETDLQRRMSAKGLNHYIIKGPIITHLEGRSNPSMKKYILYYKSMFVYLKKWVLKNG